MTGNYCHCPVASSVAFPLAAWARLLEPQAGCRPEATVRVPIGRSVHDRSNRELGAVYLPSSMKNLERSSSHRPNQLSSPSRFVASVVITTPASIFGAFKNPMSFSFVVFMIQASQFYTIQTEASLAVRKEYVGVGLFAKTTFLTSSERSSGQTGMTLLLSMIGSLLRRAKQLGSLLANLMWLLSETVSGFRNSIR